MIENSKNRQEETVMANRTKYELAASLSELLNTTPMDKITVGDIAQKANVSRQTFYYHFGDINELLEWSFGRALQQIHEIPEEDQRKKLLLAVDYLRENRVFVLNVYRSLGLEPFSKGLEHAIRLLVETAVKENAGIEIPISEKSKEFTLDFFTYGVVGSIIKWLDDGMPEDLDDIINDIYSVLNPRSEKCILPE